MSAGWPGAALDNVGRLRALAAGYPGAAYRERRIAAPFERVWGYFADMERSVPDFDETVAALTILERTPAGFTARVRGRGLPLGVTFDVDLDPGWCLMTARPAWYLVAFAAVAEGEHTRFAHAEAAIVGGPRPLRRATGPALALAGRWLGRHVERDLDGIEAAVSDRGGRRG